MYKITCYRNKKCKGVFVKTFNTLSELVKYMSLSHNIYFPYLRKELTRKEYSIVYNKLNSVLYKLSN